MHAFTILLMHSLQLRAQSDDGDHLLRKELFSRLENFKVMHVSRLNTDILVLGVSADRLRREEISMTACRSCGRPELTHPSSSISAIFLPPSCGFQMVQLGY